MKQYLALAAGGLNALGSLIEAQQLERDYYGDAEALNYNAALGRQEANNVIRVYGERESQIRRESGAALGKQRAAIGESGFEGTSGSNADVERQSRVMAELDALNVQYEGQLRYTALQTQAGMDERSARTARRRGKTARTAGYISAVGSLLTGYGNYRSGAGKD